MHVTGKKLQSFVGAMKIARQPRILASTRLNGKTHPHIKPKNHPPADKTSSGRVIDVMGDVAPAPTLGVLRCSQTVKNFRANHGLRINHRPGGTIEGHSLSLAFARQLPQRGSREGLHHSTGCSLKSWVTGDFHRPYENSKVFTFHHSSCRSETGTLRAIFIAPTETQKIFRFIMRRTTFRPGVTAGCIGWRLPRRAPEGEPFAPGGG